MIHKITHSVDLNLEVFRVFSRRIWLHDDNILGTMSSPFLGIKKDIQVYDGPTKVVKSKMIIFH